MTYPKTLLIVFFVISAWCMTFFAALSDCSVQEWSRFQCTDFNHFKSPLVTQKQADIIPTKILVPIDSKQINIAIQQSKDSPDSSTLKGQFGDFFGVLNALFGALTLVTVYFAYLLEKKSASETKHAVSEQLKSVGYERYLNDVDSAIQSYNRLLQAIVVPDKNNQWTSIHGLFHWWKGYLTSYGQLGGLHDVANGYPCTYKNPDNLQQINSRVNMWSPLLKQYGIQGVNFSSSWNNEFWIQHQIKILDPDEIIVFANRVRINWQRLYAENRYQLDALFRTWYYVCVTIQSAKKFDVDIISEWQVAARFRAQLSAIELQFLLCNQLLSESPGFPKATLMSSKYAMFNNLVSGVDPISHLLQQIAQGKLNAPAIKKMDQSCFDSNLARRNLGIVDNDNPIALIKKT
jgi:hypothetical protein